MKHAYLGIDIGSISTKGVIIDEDSRFLASEYIWTEGNPIEAVRRLLKLLEQGEGDITVIAGGLSAQWWAHPW